MTFTVMHDLILFNKPKNVVVSLSDPDHKTVYDLLPEFFRKDRWLPVGRLDLETRGALLFAQDGQLIERLTQPGRCDKTYRVELRGHLQAEHLKQIEAGVPSAVGPLRVKQLKQLGVRGHKTLLEVVLDEGRNRHIRRLFHGLKDHVCGTPLKVLQLTRTAIGSIRLDDLPLAAWRKLEAVERELLLGSSSESAGEIRP